MPELLIPPKGSGGMETTMPLTKTWPGLELGHEPPLLVGSLVHTLDPSPNSVPLATANASSASAATKSRATGPNTSSVATRIPGLIPVIPWGGRRSPGRQGRPGPHAFTAAEDGRPLGPGVFDLGGDRVTAARSPRGPTSVAGSNGSPTERASMPATKPSVNASATCRWTMNRLAAMHDWPCSAPAPATPTDTARSRSAEGSTMNGSLPPSSRTIFLPTAPACAATAGRPRRSR